VLKIIYPLSPPHDRVDGKEYQTYWFRVENGTACNSLGKSMRDSRLANSEGAVDEDHHDWLSPNYQVQRRHASLSARGRASACVNHHGSAARGRALYASPPAATQS
jgi:hypothetical protein